MSRQAIARLHITQNFGQILSWAKLCQFVPNLVDKVPKNKELMSLRRKRAEINEREWGNQMIGQENNGQWTTLLGEHLVRIVLENSGRTVSHPIKKESFKPDWETEDAIWEVKTSNWTVSGTAGEKILAVPFGYAKIPKLYGKPLKIICVAYQDWELVNKWKVFSDDVCPQKKKMLNLWKSMQIEYVSFNELADSVIVID